MGGHHYARAVQQGPFRHRFRGEHVQGGAPHPAGAQRLHQGVFVQHAAPGGVHDAHPRLDCRQGFPPDQVAGLLDQRDVDGDEIGAGQQSFQFHQLPSQPGHPLFGQIGVVDQKRHSEGQGPFRHQRPDAAQPHHPQRLPVQLHSPEPGPLPRPRPDGGVRLRNMTAHGQHQGHGMFGGGNGVGGGSAHHLRPRLPGRLQIDVVQPHPRPADNRQPGGGPDQFPIHTHPAAHHQSPRLPHQFQQALPGNVRRILHPATPSQQLQARRRNRLGRHHQGAFIVVHAFPSSAGLISGYLTAGGPPPPSSGGQTRPRPSTL